MSTINQLSITQIIKVQLELLLGSATKILILDCYIKSEPEEYKYSTYEAGQYYGNSTEFDKFKLERKRERNRIAATKCRMRKLERIAQLDSEVGQLKEQNLQLVKEGDCLRGELKNLKDILKKHMESGECRLSDVATNNPDSTS